MSIIDDAVTKSLNKNFGNLSEDYDVRSRPFDLRTELLSPKAKKIIKNTYESAVKDLNEVATLLEGAQREDTGSGRSAYRDLKREEQVLLTKSFLLANFLENIDDPNSTISMDTLSYMRLTRDWGTFDDWQTDFMACALRSRGGFVVTGYSSLLKRYMNCIVDSDMSGIPPGFTVVLCVAVCEAFYVRDYLDKKEAYVRAMMKEIQWDKVEDRIKDAESSSKRKVIKR